MNFHDVRMRGFEKRVRLDAVLDWLLTQIELLPAETISINDACGRILAEDVTAGESVPPFRRSAMDGYALKGEETNGASDYGPLRLKIIGQSFPGDSF